MYCENCGHRVSKEDKFCDNCGNKLEWVKSDGLGRGLFYWIKTHKAITAVVFLVVLLILVGETQGFNQKLSTSSASQELTNFKTRYKNSFVQQCIQSPGASESYCSCVADYLVNSYSETELTKMSSEYKLTGNAPQALTLAANSCLSSAQGTTNNNNRSQYDQARIISSVVNIFCPSNEPGGNIVGGSGTIITEEGLILTNSHIIPQDRKYLHVSSLGCMVVLPNSQTGQPSDIYLATPLVTTGLSDKYDLAMMKIYSAYYDTKKQAYSSVYPRKFTAFNNTTACTNYNVQLGEEVHVFGYPAISGGYSLTVTDGIVSSFPGSGLIVTSAKVSHGNSGGLAVDKNGCMIGIPSMVSSDQAESLGVVISMSLIDSFANKINSESPVKPYAPYSAANYYPQSQSTSSSDQTVDCTGPDGKHLKITQKQCDDFNNAWKATPIPQEGSGCGSCGANSTCSYGVCICNSGYYMNYSSNSCVAL